MDGEISMRHFPDLSNASFQIPVVHDHMLTEPVDDLAYDALDDTGLGGLDADPFMTPMPKSKRHSPLTLSDITPRGERTDRGTAYTNSSSSSRGAADKQKQNESSVRPVLSKRESADDMFERRKRDNYMQMGIDLSSKSTARLRRRPSDPHSDKLEHHEELRPGPSPRTKPRGAAKVTRPTPRSNATDGSKAKTKRSVLREDAGVVKHNPRMLPQSSARHIQPKSILKPSKPASTLPSSTLSRTVDALSRTAKAERPKWGDVVAEVQSASRGRESGGSGTGIIGGGLIDVLVMYGEKLKGSLGFSSSTSTPTESLNPPRMLPPNTLRDKSQNLIDHPRNPTPNTAGPSSKPLTLSDLSPSKSDDLRGHEPLTLSQLSPWRQPPVSSHMNGDSDESEPSQLATSPMRPSKKRAATGSPRDKPRKERITPAPEFPEPSETAIIPVPRPRALGPSAAANGVHNNANTSMYSRPQPQLATANNVPATGKPEIVTVSCRDLKGKCIEAASNPSHSIRITGKEQHPPCSSALSGPAFARDVYRQRALDKAQAEREKREQKEKRKRAQKAGVMPCFHKPAPPARPTVRTTVPAAFTFRSEARVAQRNVEFEEKRKTWESRSTVRHALPMPDFAAMHAAQAGAVRTRRAVPVLPTEAPALTTMVRAKEREKYEEERRAREKATEKLRVMREKEREIQEEIAYKEARKRTVPRAHEVPAWYKDAPKRKEGN